MEGLSTWTIEQAALGHSADSMNEEALLTGSNWDCGKHGYATPSCADGGTPFAGIPIPASRLGATFRFLYQQNLSTIRRATGSSTCLKIVRTARIRSGSLICKATRLSRTSSISQLDIDGMVL